MKKYLVPFLLVAALAMPAYAMEREPLAVNVLAQIESLRAQIAELQAQIAGIKFAQNNVSSKTGIQILSPKEGSDFSKGDTVTISWVLRDTASSTDRHRLLLCSVDVGCAKTLYTGPATSSIQWVVPDLQAEFGSPASTIPKEKIGKKFYFLVYVDRALRDFRVSGKHSFIYEIPKPASLSVSFGATPKLTAGVPREALAEVKIKAQNDAVSFKSIVFSENGKGGGPLITNVTLHNEKDEVVSGPFDVSPEGKLVMTDTVTIPKGEWKYKLRGTVHQNSAGEIFYLKYEGVTGAVEVKTGNPVTKLQGIGSTVKINVDDTKINLKLKLDGVKGVEKGDSIQYNFHEGFLIASIEANKDVVEVGSWKLKLQCSPELVMVGKNEVNYCGQTLELATDFRAFAEDYPFLTTDIQNTGSSRGLLELTLMAYGKNGNQLAMDVATVTMKPRTTSQKRPPLDLRIPAGPSSQTLVPGVVGATVAHYMFDATGAQEDIRFSSLGGILLKSRDGFANTNLTGCQLFDGSTALNTGSNVLNPTEKDVQRITFDTALTVPKASAKLLVLKCNILSSARGLFAFGIRNDSSTLVATGVTTGNSASVSIKEGYAGTVTMGTTLLLISLDPSSPAASAVAGGMTRVPVGTVRFRAAGDAVTLNRIGFELVSGSPQSLVQLHVMDGALQVGTFVFVGNQRYATSTLTAPVLLPRDTDKTLTILADFGNVSSSGPAVPGDLIKLAVIDGASTEGVGISSGTTVRAKGSALFAPITLHRSLPIVGGVSLPSSGRSDGKLIRFAVTARPSGEVTLGQLSFDFSSAPQNVQIFAYTDGSYASPISNGAAGQIYVASGTAPTLLKARITPLVIPAGQTRFFELRGTVPTSNAMITTLLGDDRGGALETFSFAASGANFIWSPNSKRASSATDVDWTSGYLVPGLSEKGILQIRY